MTTPSTPKFCSNCGTSLAPGANFCHGCGIALGAGTSPAAGGPTAGSNLVRWGVPLGALAVVLTLVAIQFATKDPAPQEPAFPIGGGRAPDLSTMSPDEQADRLFNRVMALAERGSDSVTFFAPMAMGAIQALEPLDAHRRYDLGLVAVVSGSPDIATAHADTILRARSNHLLGLILAARAAEAAGNTKSAASYWQRLVGAEAAEKAAALPEYTAHDRDIEEALKRARGA